MAYVIESIRNGERMCHAMPHHGPTEHAMTSLGHSRGAEVVIVRLFMFYSSTFGQNRAKTMKPGEPSGRVFQSIKSRSYPCN